MAIRYIVKEGDDVLTKKCRPVTCFDDRLRQLAQDMKDTLLDADGLGLAAPQVGVLKRMVIVMDEDGSLITLVNPEILSQKGSQEAREGCLSIPGVWGRTVRPAKVKVRAFDADGREFVIERTGITAVCLCHEIDHLDGVLFRRRVVEYIDMD